MKLSIIIVSYNTKNLLCACLRSIMKHAKLVDLEIIVTDNASTDSSVEMVQEDFPTVILIQNSLNLGFAKAVNQGLAVARGEYYLLLNSDTEVLNEAIQQSATFLDEHPDAGIVGCRLLNSDGSVQPSCETFADLNGFFFESFFLEKAFPRNKLFGRMHLTYFDYTRLAKVNYVKGAFLMIRRQTVEDVGLLDEDFFFYAEEMDWCYRARQKGWEVYFTPDAEILHHGGQSSDPVSPHMFVQLHKNRFRFYRKHHGVIKSWIARGVLAIGAFLRLGAWSMIAAMHLFFQKSKLDFATKKVIAFRAAFLWYIGLARNWEKA